MSLPFHDSKLGKLSSGHRTGKRQFSFQSLRKAIPKNAQTTAQLHSSHTSKVMLKIHQTRLQQYMNREFPDVQAGFRKGRGTRDHQKSKRVPKKICFWFIDYAKPSTLWITINCGKFWKRWEYQTTWPASWETCMQVRKQQLELDIEQQTSSK